MKINDVELEDLDLMDAEIAERYEKAVNKLAENEEKQVTSDMGLSEIIRAKCTLIFDFFNDIWGEGTDKKIFGAKVNYRQCENAFKEVVEYALLQTKEIGKVAKIKR